MGYNSFLDAWFSSFWYTGILLLVLIVVAVFFHRPLWSERKYKFALGAVYFSLVMLILFLYLYFNPIFWGYGHGVEVHDIRANDETVVVMDYVLEAGDEASEPVPHYRLHFVDINTGEKRARVLVGPYTQLYGLTQQEALIYRNPDDLRFYDAKTGSQKAQLTRETLPQLYPEMASGIDQFQPNQYENGLSVTAKNGKQYYVDFATRAIMAKPETKIKTPKEGELVFTDEAVTLQKNGNPKRLLHITGDGYNDKLKKIKNDRDSILNPQLTYLDGSVVALDQKDSIFVILHFETTDHQQFRISAVSLDGRKQIWQLRQEDLKFEEREIYTVHDYTKHHFAQAPGQEHQLIFSFNKEVLKLDITSGKVLWRIKI